MSSKGYKASRKITIHTFRVVGYLQRTEAFSETDLRLRFLQDRDAWLNGLLTGILKDDPQEHLTKTIR